MTVIGCMVLSKRMDIFKSNERTHVWGNENPLRKPPCGQILFEQRKIFNIGAAGRISRD